MGIRKLTGIPYLGNSGVGLGIGEGLGIGDVELLGILVPEIVWALAGTCGNRLGNSIVGMIGVLFEDTTKIENHDTVRKVMNKKSTWLNCNKIFSVCNLVGLLLVVLVLNYSIVRKEIIFSADHKSKSYNSEKPS